MNIDLSNAWKATDRIVNSAIASLPNLALAIVILVLAAVIARVAKSLVRKIASRHQKRQSLGILLGQMTQLAIVILSLLIALSVVAPSFHAVDLVKILGIGSVAIGFAFQNILQNFLAGILLLLNEPFEIGDLISVTGIEGRVDDIQARATVITTETGRKVVIPNATLFTNAVAVAAPPGADYGKIKEPAAGGTGSAVENATTSKSPPDENPK